MSAAAAGSGFALRVFAPSASDGAVPGPAEERSSPPSSAGCFSRRPRPPQTTLDVWRTMRPRLEAAGRATESLAEYGRYCRRWDAFCAGQDRMVHPVLSASRETLEAWRQVLLQDGLGPSTANKALRLVSAVLAEAAACGWSEGPPKLRPLAERGAAAKLVLSDEQLVALYRACAGATWPTRARGRGALPGGAAAQWRAALVLWATFGLRTEDQCAYGGDSAATALCWEHVSWDALTPAPDGTAESRWGWLWHQPRKTRRVKPEPLVLPLTEAAHAHLRVLWTPGASGRVFPWPLDSDAFYAAWRALLARAQIRPRPSLDGRVREYLPKHLRQTALTRMALHRGLELAQHVTGHAPRSVAARHYLQPERLLVEALGSLPWPAAMLRPPAVATERQRLLWEGE